MDLRQFPEGQTQHPSPGFPWAVSYATAQSLFLSRMKLFLHLCSTDWSGPWQTQGSPVQISRISSCRERFVYGWWWQANHSVPCFSLTGWVERFGCQTSVRPHFSSLLRRVPLAAANIWLWLICQGWLYSGNGEMDCQLQLVFSDCLADEGLAAGLTALEHSRCRLGGKEPIFKWVLKMRKGSRWLIFFFFFYILADAWPGIFGKHHRKESYSEIFFLFCWFKMLYTFDFSLNSTNERCERVHSIFHTKNAPREAVSPMPSEMLPTC